jgi:5-methylcytosine-specific restriction protein A
LMPNLKIRDLPAPITASKADWLAATTWIGFSPPSDDLQSRNDCSRTIQRQFGKGYIIEYITEQFSQPNPGFENDPDYLAEREAHKEQAGRFIGVHRLRYSSRPLEAILGADGYKKLQDMWAQGGKRWRWSVAFSIIESYRIVGQPKAKEVLGDAGYRRLFAHSSATLRPLNDDERATLADLDLEPVVAGNAWIAIEDEFQNAEAYPLTPFGMRDMQRDLPDSALEGMTDERRAKVRKRAAWLADRFVILRSKAGTLHCDDCKFDPRSAFPSGGVKPRSLLDVHHKRPIEEGVRYTTVDDFALLCPTCHRIEHARMKLAEKAAKAAG